MEHVRLEALIIRQRCRKRQCFFSPQESSSWNKENMNRKQASVFGELVVCDLQVLNYGLSPSLPLQAFKVRPGRKAGHTVYKGKTLWDSVLLNHHHHHQY